jgi:hypothetical protein
MRLTELSYVSATILATAIAIYFVVIAKDYLLFNEVASSNSCCGWVSNNYLIRPYTYIKVDKWSDPIWKPNAIHSEEWLVSDGMVGGQVKFWRIIDRKPIGE